MNVVVFGAAGLTGRLVVEKALSDGYSVRAVARTPSKVALTHERLTVVKGDVTDPGAVARAIGAGDVVISAVGAPQNRQPTQVQEEAVLHISAAMRAAGARRLIVITSGGTNPRDDPNLPWIFKNVFRKLYWNIYQDQINAERRLIESGLDWTIARPAGLTNAPGTGRYRAEAGYSIKGGTTISRADLADFVVKQVRAVEYVGKGVALAD